MLHRSLPLDYFFVYFFLILCTLATLGKRLYPGVVVWIQGMKFLVVKNAQVLLRISPSGTNIVRPVYLLHVPRRQGHKKRNDIKRCTLKKQKLICFVFIYPQSCDFYSLLLWRYKCF